MPPQSQDRIAVFPGKIIKASMADLAGPASASGAHPVKVTCHQPSPTGLLMTDNITHRLTQFSHGAG